MSESDITIIRAPGAFEIPLVAQKVAQRGEYAAILALGAGIRGGAPHFEYVAGECTKGLAQVFEGVPADAVKAFGADRGAMSTGMTRIRPADGAAAYKSYLRRLAGSTTEIA